MSDIIINNQTFLGVKTISVNNTNGEIAKYTEGGGGGTEDSGGKYLVKVIDYDGTVLKQDHLDTGATFTLPEAPTNHSRLIFQEWSSPVDITNNTITVENQDITIGAVYTTSSGLSEFDITLTKVTGLSVTLNMDGTKDWGDGTSDTSTTHTYTNYGDYTITCDGTTMTTSSSNQLFGYSGSRNYIPKNAYFASGVTNIGDYAFYYNSLLSYITIPSSVTTIGSDVFSNCYLLKNATIPSSVTTIGDTVFNKCHSLKSLTIPNSVTQLPANTVNNCNSLKSLTIPNSVTKFGTYSFGNCYLLTNITIPRNVTNITSAVFYFCYGCLKYDMSAFTKIPTLQNSTAFSGINALTKIVVPDALYDEWIVATNWATYANYIYKASEMQIGD